MSDAGTVGIYYIVLGKHPATIVRLDYGAGETMLCLAFSKVSGRSFLNQCLKDDILVKVDFESFEKLWEMYEIPDFHYEEEVVIEGHAADVLCTYLSVYVDLFNHSYDFTEVYEFFKEKRDCDFIIPFEYKGCSSEYAPKDLSAILVGYNTNTVSYFYDQHDAIALASLHDDYHYKKRTRKQVVHSSLPDRTFESVRTYTGLIGELIAYLFWINNEFG